ncbi:MAG TPA: ABC transporter ATP-binding protein [Ktedonobacterales bacterium]|nr:ABC transporter ATP-binding protein [Ktedonobacterales bacterium]
MLHENLPCPPAALSFEQLSFAYREHLVVREVTTSIAEGEMVALLGPNGAGKSTLLKLAAGALHPGGGSIRLLDRALTRLSQREIARQVAFIPQDFSVQFAYTVRQIVSLGRTPYLGILGVERSEDRQAVEEALADASLVKLADRVFNELSGGERQRVLVALALAQHSPIVLLDEPTAHLDIKHQVEVLELLRRLNRARGLTVIAALHDLNLAARYFPRLILFRNAVVAEGPPAQVLDSALLSMVYETPVQVGILRGEEHLSVLPPSASDDATAASKQATERARVHAIAGGGTGELLMRALADAAVPFTAGPLNIGDSDYVLAQRLAQECVIEPPYAPVSAQGAARARELVNSAEATVVCPAPIGPGNLALFELALEARSTGRNVILLELAGSLLDTTAMLEAVGERDFSGRGVALYEQLLESGCLIVTSPADVLEQIRTRAGTSGSTS